MEDIMKLFLFFCIACLVFVDGKASDNLISTDIDGARILNGEASPERDSCTIAFLAIKRIDKTNDYKVSHELKTAFASLFGDCQVREQTKFIAVGKKNIDTSFINLYLFFVSPKDSISDKIFTEILCPKIGELLVFAGFGANLNGYFDRYYAIFIDSPTIAKGNRMSALDIKKAIETFTKTTNGAQSHR